MTATRYFYSEFLAGTGGLGVAYDIRNVKTLAGAKRKVTTWHDRANSLTVVAEELDGDTYTIDPYTIVAIKQNETGRWLSGRTFEDVKDYIIDFTIGNDE